MRKLIRATLLMLGSTLVLACALQSSYAAESNGDAKLQGPGPKLGWQRGQYVGICDGPQQQCAAVKMPKGLGKVVGIFPGPIVKEARASWIALSRFDTFVCAAVRFKVACARIDAGEFPLQYADLRVKYTPTGKTRLAVIPKASVQDSSQLTKYERELNRAYRTSTKVLEAEVEAVKYSNTSFSSTMSVCDQQPPGDAPDPNCVWDEGTWWCPGEMPTDPYCQNLVYDEQGHPYWGCVSPPPPPPEEEPDPGTGGDDGGDDGGGGGGGGGGGSGGC